MANSPTFDGITLLHVVRPSKTKTSSMLQSLIAIGKSLQLILS